MQCDIFKASTRDELYLYLPAVANESDSQTSDLTDEQALEQRLQPLPEPVRNVLGRLQFIMHLDLTKTTKLARVSHTAVLKALQTQGYFLQFPPEGLISPTAVAPEGLRGA